MEGRVDTGKSTFSNARTGCGVEIGKEENWRRGDGSGSKRSNPEGDGQLKERSTEGHAFHRYKEGGSTRRDISLEVGPEREGAPGTTPENLA